jgi:hypothetical protein
MRVRTRRFQKKAARHASSLPHDMRLILRHYAPFIIRFSGTFADENSAFLHYVGIGYSNVSRQR